MAKGFIFDVDGTILDSMSIWMDAGKLYLESLGIKTDENIGEVMFDLTMAEGAEYLKKNYGLDLSIEEICDGINNRVFEFYDKEAMEKKYVRNFIEDAKEMDIKMTIATSTDRPMIEAALKRLDLMKYFDEIFTTTEVGKGKASPDIFLKAMEKMGTTTADTWLLEDAAYSMRTAKGMGLNTVGIYDESSAGNQEQVKELADIYITDWSGYKDVMRKIEEK